MALPRTLFATVLGVTIGRGYHTGAGAPDFELDAVELSDLGLIHIPVPSARRLVERIGARQLLDGHELQVRGSRHWLNLHLDLS